MKPSLLRGGSVPALLSLLSLLSTPASAQKVLYTLDGTPGANLGSAVDGAGDVDGDGLADLLVGAPLTTTGAGSNAGQVIVYSGADASVLWILDGDAADDGLGSAVAGLGDLDGDGFGEFAVAQPGDDDAALDAGGVWVIDGATGAVRYDLEGAAAGDTFGKSIGGGGDVDGDGVPDLVIGIPKDDAAGADAGAVVVVSGATGLVVRTFQGDAPGDGMGTSVAIAGDVDADGFADVIAGAPAADPAGAGSGLARVWSGQTSAVLYTFPGAAASDFMGSAVDGAGNLNGDAHAELIVGAAGESSNGLFSGAAYVFSGSTGNVLYTIQGAQAGTLLGTAVVGLGDVDGDAFGDFAVGAHLDDTLATNAGEVQLYSGQFGVLLHALRGQGKNDNLGFAVASAGDVNGNGRDDVLIGVPLKDEGGADAGRVLVIAGQGLVGTVYCNPAVANSTGLPAELLAYGTELVVDNDFSLKTTRLPFKQFGYYLASEQQGFFPNPGNSQGNLCLNGTIGRFNKQAATSGLTGVITLDVDLNALPGPLPPAVLPGDTWNFQLWYRDAMVNNFSDGVSVTFQ